MLQSSRHRAILQHRRTQHERPPRSTYLGAGLKLVLGALLLALGAPAAHAGEYVCAPPHGGAGRVLATPAGGSEVTITLPFDPAMGPYWSSGSGFDGTIDYSYTESYDYYWIPAFGGEQPLSGTYRLEGEVTLDFASSSGIQWAGGSASATMTMGGNTASASATASPPDQFPPPVGVGTTALYVDVPVSGEMGTFTVTYTGSMSTSGNGSITGSFEFDRWAPGMNGRVRILNPDYNATVAIAPQSFTVDGWHNRGAHGADSASYKVTVWARHWDGVEQLKGDTGILAYKGTWSKSDVQITDPGEDIELSAQLFKYTHDSRYDVWYWQEATEPDRIWVRAE